jgi:hypothetical protein
MAFSSRWGTLIQSTGTEALVDPFILQKRLEIAIPNVNDEAVALVLGYWPKFKI